MNKASKKNIAIVANSTWNVYNFRLNILEALLTAGYKVFVVAPIDEYIEYIEKYPSVSHITLRHLSRDGLSIGRNLKLIRELGKIFRDNRIDCVISYTHKPNILGSIAKPKKTISIAVITGLGYSFLHSHWLKRLIIFLYKRTSSRHDLFIFENEDDKAYFIEKKIIELNNAQAVKGCGVDLNYYKPQEKKLKPKVIYTYVGRLLYDKGIREFYEAAKCIKEKYPDKAECWILGELDDYNPATVKKDELLHWIDSGAIRYLGFKRDVRAFIQKSDCIVLPSYREGMPRINMEAAAMATPVITTDVAGCRETVIHGETGYLVPLKDHKALFNSMEKFLLISASQKLEMGRKGMDFAKQNFSATEIAAVYLGHVNRLMEEHAEGIMH